MVPIVNVQGNESVLLRLPVKGNPMSTRYALAASSVSSCFASIYSHTIVDQRFISFQATAISLELLRWLLTRALPLHLSLLLSFILDRPVRWPASTYLDFVRRRSAVVGQRSASLGGGLSCANL